MMRAELNLRHLRPATEADSQAATISAGIFDALLFNFETRSGRCLFESKAMR